MAIEHIYTCDKCGERVNHSNNKPKFFPLYTEYSTPVTYKSRKLGINLQIAIRHNTDINKEQFCFPCVHRAIVDIANQLLTDKVTGKEETND